MVEEADRHFRQWDLFFLALAVRSCLERGQLYARTFFKDPPQLHDWANYAAGGTADKVVVLAKAKEVSMPGWKTTTVNAIWRLENADYHGHRLTVYRSRAAGAYRACLDGRTVGLWRSKEAAMAAAEKAAFARNIEDHMKACSDP